MSQLTTFPFAAVDGLAAKKPVRYVKTYPGNNLVIRKSKAAPQSLPWDRPVDDIKPFVCPVAIRKRYALFTSSNDNIPLSLIQSTAYKNSLVQLVYTLSLTN